MLISIKKLVNRKEKWTGALSWCAGANLICSALAFCDKDSTSKKTGKD